MNKTLMQTLTQLAEQGGKIIPIAGYDGMHVKIHTVGSLNIISERAQVLREKYPNDPYLSERLAALDFYDEQGNWLFDSDNAEQMAMLQKIPFAVRQEWQQAVETALSSQTPKNLAIGKLS